MSFFGKLKSTGPTSPNIGSSPQKKDSHALTPTPLEKLLTNAGPLRNDGSDKFFGMENFGNTCYCNSILQCLYYSSPFRETVLSYPKRSSPESVNTAATKALPRAIGQANGAKKAPPANRNINNSSGQGQNKDDKDSPEYKKKVALAAGPILNISYGNAPSYDMPESLFTSLKDVFEAAATNRSRTGVISPIKLLEVLRKENEMFRSAMHQDAHEFLNLLLNAVVEEIEKHEKKIEAEKMLNKAEHDNSEAIENSETGTISFPSLFPVAKTGTPQSRWLQELFEGTLTSETRCLTCENISQRDEPFLDLSVDLEQHSSVTSCLRRFSEEEMLCERNKFHCDNCGGLQEAEKRMKIKRLPKILALHLKRFKYTEDLQRLQKLFHRVVYPYHLRLFNTTDDAENPDRLYELYAVVVHIGGGPYHGHYVAIIKTQDKGWLLFDDEMVEPVDRSFVRNFFGDRPGLACAYVLFYQETTVEAMQKELRMEGHRIRYSEGAPVGLGVTTNEAAAIHRVYSAATPANSPTSPSAFANLDHAVTAPPLQPNGHIQLPSSPPLSTMPSAPSVAPTSSIVQSRKENFKVGETLIRSNESTTSSEDHEKDTTQKAPLTNLPPQQVLPIPPPPSNGATTTTPTKDTGLDRFKRTSKSLRFGSLSRKDKDKAQQMGAAVGSAIADDSNPTGAGADQGTGLPEKEKEKEKKSRFSIRKKSFGMLS